MWTASNRLSAWAAWLGSAAHGVTAFRVMRLGFVSLSQARSRQHVASQYGRDDVAFDCIGRLPFHGLSTTTAAVSTPTRGEREVMSMRMKAMCLAMAAALAAPLGAHAQMVMRASHQFPGGKGDVRDDMVQMIAKEVGSDKVGITMQVYPGASLFKPNQQWDAMVNGQLDIALFPLDYASGKVPVFSATLMPGLIRNQDRAKRINASPFMTDVRAAIEKNGVIVLSDAWFAGGMAAKGHCILKPDDLKGMKFRAAGPTFAAMWQAAGASIVSPPSNEIYNAFQTGVISGTDTSLGTFDSMRLYEVSSCLTAPGDNALWFMYEPVLMSKMSFAKLNKQQQDAVLKAGKDAQAYYEGKAAAVNQETIKDFNAHKVKVVTLDNAQYDAWIDLAKKSSYKKFDQEVPNGQKLIDEALAVK
jgi:TRAP-type C4-dicarboxylate transport system substrate-binding protein